MARKDILDKATLHLKLRRMAFEIIENNLDEEMIILVGVKDNGVVIARNMEKILREVGHLPVQLIELSLDKKNPREVTLSQQLDFDKRVIIIVDDVASSGSTFMYALKPFLAFHPRKIQTLALVERTHKAFPINLDYVGLSVATTLQEHIYVAVSGEEINGAYLQ